MNWEIRCYCCYLLFLAPILREPGHLQMTCQLCYHWKYWSNSCSRMPRWQTSGHIGISFKRKKNKTGWLFQNPGKRFTKKMLPRWSKLKSHYYRFCQKSLFKHKRGPGNQCDIIKAKKKYLCHGDQNLYFLLKVSLKARKWLSRPGTPVISGVPGGHVHQKFLDFHEFLKLFSKVLHQMREMQPRRRTKQ